MPYGLGYTPFEDDAQHMAMLPRDRVRTRLSGVPFDYPLRLYTFQLADYFTREPEHAPHIEGVDHVSKMVEIRGIQQALRQMCLSSKTTEATRGHDSFTPITGLSQCVFHVLSLGGPCLCSTYGFGRWSRWCDFV